MRWIPIQILLFSILVVTLLASYALKICERPLMTALIKTNPDSLDNGSNIADYNNALWCILITMATGFVFPLSFLNFPTFSLQWGMAISIHAPALVGLWGSSSACTAVVPFQ